MLRNETHADGELRKTKKRESAARPTCMNSGSTGGRAPADVGGEPQMGEPSSKSQRFTFTFTQHGNCVSRLPPEFLNRITISHVESGCARAHSFNQPCQSKAFLGVAPHAPPSNEHHRGQPGVRRTSMDHHRMRNQHTERSQSSSHHDRQTLRAHARRA